MNQNETPCVVVTLAGKEYRLDRRQMTANDAKDFRGAVGVPLTKVMAEGSWDVDVVAGIVWLVRRRTERTLAYQTVAAGITYDSDIDINLAGRTPAEETDPGEA